MRKRLLVTQLTVLCISVCAIAQRPPAPGRDRMATNSDPVYQNPLPPSKKAVLAPDSTVITRHTSVIRGASLPYTAYAGTLPVYNEEGSPIAGVFYTYYEREGIEDRTKRPLLISFNGGPGTASLWMEIGYTGPRLLQIDDEGNPIQPYGMRDNPYSLLDEADIVYVDPVNTGYSRKTGKEVPGSLFFGVNEDIKYLAQWISLFVTRYNRWKSPKFIIGESYGTTRVSGLALELQKTQFMYLNGVILVSPTTLGIDRPGPLAGALKTPYFAATAWYHKQLASEYEQKKIEDFLPEVENFTINELLPALARGGTLDKATRTAVAGKLAKYTGVDAMVYMANNLDVSSQQFWKELLRKQGHTIGRLDSRYLGLDKKNAGEISDYNPEQVEWNNAFSPAMNDYLKNELGYKTDLKYYVFGPVRPWNQENNNTGNDLGDAMRQNPALHLLVQSGYFDGACDFFNAKYSMWQIDQGGNLQDRMEWAGYESGHMMYLRMKDRIKATEKLRAFIKSAINFGSPIKY